MQPLPFAQSSAQNFYEGVLGIGARVWFRPWLNIAFIEGISYNTSKSNFELTNRNKQSQLLNYLGAEILTADPHRIIIREKAINFHGGEIAAPRIIQGTKAIFLAAIADPVETTIHGVNILRRRYPKIFETYKNLGVIIEYE